VQRKQSGNNNLKKDNVVIIYKLTTASVNRYGETTRNEIRQNENS